MKKYTATKNIKIDGYAFSAGDVVGTDDGSGFVPANGCPRINIGHVNARIARGLVAEGSAESAKTPKKTKAAKASPKTND